MTRILITGALGFIGRSLIDDMIKFENKFEIFAIDIKEFPENCDYLQTKINYERVDIRVKQDVEDYFKKNSFDGVIHLAAVSRVVDAENNKKNCIDTNYFGTLNIVECLSACRIKPWIIFSSSREVYGEQTNFPVCENACKLPLNIYGFYKLEGERLIEKYMDNFFILRFSNVYGNTYDIEDRVIPRFVINALKGNFLILEGGDQLIDFTFIDDTVNSIISCIEILSSRKKGCDHLHILPGIENKITDVINILKSELSHDILVRVNEKRKYDVEKFIGDNTKRLIILGNNEFKTLKEGLVKTLDVYRKNLRNKDVTNQVIV